MTRTEMTRLVDALHEQFSGGFVEMTASGTKRTIQHRMKRIHKNMIEQTIQQALKKGGQS